MAQNQQTSAQVASIAAKAMQNPSSLSNDEIKTLAASVQSQSSEFNQQSTPNNQQGQPSQQSQRK
jgi:cytochrome c553